MARARKPDLDFSPDCMAAMDRLTALAHQMASVLTGDPLSPKGMTQTPRSQALTMGMIAFLMRSGPDDLHALFFADGSLKAVPFKPGPPQAMRDAPLAALLS